MTSCPLCGFPFAADHDGTHLPRCIYEVATEAWSPPLRHDELPQRDERCLIFTPWKELSMNTETVIVIENLADERIAFHLANNAQMRLITILLGLRMEIRIPGMRLTRKAPKCSTILRKEFGLKGKPEQLLQQYQVLLVKHGMELPS